MHYDYWIKKTGVGVFDNKKWKEYLDCAEKGDENNIRKMVNILRDNSWAKYFANCNAEIDGWVDFEREMKPVLRTFNYVITDGYEMNICGSGNNRRVYQNSDIIRITKLWEKYFIKSQSSTSNDKMAKSAIIKIAEKYYDGTHGICVKRMISDLKQELEDFIEAFSIYLGDIARNKTISQISPFKEMKVSDIICFNYTSTFWKYDVFSNSHTYFVHGEVGTPGEMILGVDKVDDDAEYLFKEFEKRYQRLLKNINSENTNIKPRYKKIIEEGDYELTIYGHSLDVTDKSILEPLISNANSTSIYYYTDENGFSDYSLKVKNIMMLLGDEIAEKKVEDGIIVFKEAM